MQTKPAHRIIYPKRCVTLCLLGLVSGIVGWVHILSRFTELSFFDRILNSMQSVILHNVLNVSNREVLTCVKFNIL